MATDDVADENERLASEIAAMQAQLDPNAPAAAGLMARLDLPEARFCRPKLVLPLPPRQCLLQSKQCFGDGGVPCCAHLAAGVTSNWPFTALDLSIIQLLT